MRSSISLTAALFTLLCLLLCNGSNTDAQEVRKALRDYRQDQIFNFSPNDPWTRSKLFNMHTGHYGRYHNCDDEECKRNSPYICWKAHNERDFPSHLGLIASLKHDWADVMQRYRDGAGPCAADCNCNQCQPTRQAHTTAHQQCGCEQCSLARAILASGIDGQLVHSSIAASPQPVVRQHVVHQHATSTKSSRKITTPQRRVVSQKLPTRVTEQMAAVPKFGLVSGKIIDTYQRPAPVAVARVSQTVIEARSAVQSVIETEQTRVAQQMTWDEYLQGRRHR